MNSLAYSVEDAVAVYFEGYLTIRATISVTATNMAAYLQRSPIMIYPPSHDFYACERQTSPIGADVIIPQTVTQIFPAPGGKPNTIKLIAKENTLDVDVRGVDPLAPSITAVTGKFERTANGETAGSATAHRANGRSVVIMKFLVSLLLATASAMLVCNAAPAKNQP